MKDRSNRTIERPNRVLGILAAVLVAWALLVPLPFLVALADHLWWGPPGPRSQTFNWPAFGDIVLWVFAMAVVGLPLSLFFCFGGGYPAWLVATRLGMKRRRDAMIVGACLGLVLAGLLAFLRIWIGLGQLPSHEATSRILVLYPGVAFYVIAVGILAGLAAWWAAGRKSDHRDAMARVFA